MIVLYLILYVTERSVGATCQRSITQWINKGVVQITQLLKMGKLYELILLIRNGKHTAFNEFNFIINVILLN